MELTMEEFEGDAGVHERVAAVQGGEDARMACHQVVPCAAILLSLRTPHSSAPGLVEVLMSSCALRPFLRCPRRCGRTDITARFALMIKFGAVMVGAVAIALVAMLPEGDS